MAIYSALGSSMGGCGVPDNRHQVTDPTNNRYFSSALATASGSRQGGYHYSVGGSFRTVCINGQWVKVWR